MRWTRASASSTSRRRRGSCAVAGGRMTGLMVQRMSLGEPDQSGRRRPVPVEGDVYEIAADTLIAAVSQEPDWATLGTTRGEGRVARSGRLGPERAAGGVVRRRFTRPWPRDPRHRPGPQGGRGHPRGAPRHRAAAARAKTGRSVRTASSSTSTRRCRAPHGSVLGPEERLANPRAEVDSGLDHRSGDRRKRPAACRAGCASGASAAGCTARTTA